MACPAHSHTHSTRTAGISTQAPRSILRPHSPPAMGWLLPSVGLCRAEVPRTGLGCNSVKSQGRAVPGATGLVWAPQQHGTPALGPDMT